MVEVNNNNTYHAKTKENLFDEFKTSDKGLTNEEARISQPFDLYFICSDDYFFCV